MSELFYFNLLLFGFGLVSAIVFILLFFISAPYGKLIRNRWGPTLNNKIGWFIMEVPTIIIFVFLYFTGKRIGDLVPTIFLVIWLIHYGHRALIFPFLLRGKSRMPVVIMLFGLSFNLINTYLQGRWINTFAMGYGSNWVLTPVFIVGIIIFFIGYFINIQSDYIIRNLRKPGETEHKVPYGGLYKWVSSPNYLGEIIEWGGWAIMTLALPGAIFFVWTFANLAPRAISNHKWYKQKFAEYPKERKALIPFIL